MRQVFDSDTIKVISFATVPSWLTLTNASTFFVMLSAVASLAYTLYKWVKSSKKEDE